MVGWEGSVETKAVGDDTEGGTTEEVCSWGSSRTAFKKEKVAPDCEIAVRKSRESSLKMYTAAAWSVSSCCLILHQPHTESHSGVSFGKTICTISMLLKEGPVCCASA